MVARIYRMLVLIFEFPLCNMFTNYKRNTQQKGNMLVKR